MAPFIDDSMSSKRPSMLLLDTRVSFSDLPPSSSVQKPGTELASNSQVDDLGNGKHLEQQEDSEDLDSGATGSSQPPADILVAKTGTRFKSEGDSRPMPGDSDAPAESQPSSTGYDESLLETAIPETQDTTLTECTGSLGDELREAYCDTESKQRSDFLPIDALDRIVTEDRVKEEIGKLSGCSRKNLNHDVQQVLGAASTIPGQTTSRKKIFAILALIDKLDAIWDFVTEGIYDVHLPFEKEKAQSPGGHEKWNVHIPIFFLNTKKDPKVRHYPLQESVVLPFIEDDEVKQGGKMGGFADVWRIKFHPSHHNQGVLASGKRENPSFAIKRLRYMDEKAFRKEVQNLKRFSTRDYLHLIKLLGTYEWRHQYYLVFPWADGNLLDFWEKHPEPLAPKRDINTALWFSKQCLGLVEGMKMIHTWDTPDVDGQHNMFSFPTHQIYGLHGDLKPENILWFKQYETHTEQSSSSMGHFKISDFGLSHFHGTKSVADIDAKDMGFSPTYRAPERDVKGKVAQSYDVWSLACVLLEFASWYLGGYEEVKTFSQKRVKEDMQYDGGYRQDRFFNFMRASQGVSDEVQARAQICAIEKVSVVQEFERLYDDPHCSDYLLDFLKLIQKNLLRLGPEKRSDCTEILESLQKFDDTLQKDPSYGINRVQNPPSRSPTLDSVLMEGDISAEFKKQIRKNLPRRSLSWDRETPSIPGVLSSPSSSHINLVSSARRDSRTSSPERKANFRLSKELTTVQESPGGQAHEDPGKEQHSHPGGQATLTEDTAQTDEDHKLSTANAAGLNITCGEASRLRLGEEQQQRPSDTENTQQIRAVDNAAAEVASTERALGAGSDEDEASGKNPPSKPDCVTNAEEQAKRDDGEAPQPAMDATALPEANGASQPAHPTKDNDDEHQVSSSDVPQGVELVEHLKVPLGGAEGRFSSESTTLFQDTSDVGKEDARSRRTRNSSRTGSHGREKMAKQIGNEGSVIEASIMKSTSDEKAGRRRFKFLFKKIPCFN
ncbi:hypothetical protein INS49_007179 [Diaporthe citri]|uniref:uncharacterized protein n=1 Tax=Diaporthe citri TaxID=83186 RepID=UPI001C80DFB2|nr:uncharacterized protein INS49_007179 [Diaporthe citri]KAG6365568.1 hypothetical protein INS49_007179 [Diaporthe citri]